MICSFFFSFWNYREKASTSSHCYKNKLMYSFDFFLLSRFSMLTIFFFFFFANFPIRKKLRYLIPAEMANFGTVPIFLVKKRKLHRKQEVTLWWNSDLICFQFIFYIWSLVQTFKWTPCIIRMIRLFKKYFYAHFTKCVLFYLFSVNLSELPVRFISLLLNMGIKHEVCLKSFSINSTLFYD